MSRLNYSLFSILAGLLLATYFSVSLWWFIPATVLLYFRYLRWGFLIIAAAVWADVICYTAPIKKSATCHAVVYVDEFPTPRYPFGYREFLTVIAPENCPLKKGDRLLGSLFLREPLPLGGVFRANLKLNPPQNNTYLQREKFRAYASISNPLIVVDIPAPWLVRQRAAIAEKITMLFPQYQGWLQALLIGNRSAISAYGREDLKRTGTSHLMAISGLHLALIALVLFTFLQAFFAFLPTRWQKVEPRTFALHGSLWLTFFYALLTGGAPPVLRAWLMFLLAVISWHTPLLRKQKHFLSLAAILLFFWQPWQFTSASAWFSFAAVALILYSAEYWRGRSTFYQLIFLQGLLTFGLLPLSWAIFGGFSVIGFFANLLLIPWLAPLLLSVFLALICPWFTPLTQYLVEHYFSALSVLAHLDWAYLSPNWQPSIMGALGWTFASILLLQKDLRNACICLLFTGVYSVYLILTPAKEVIFSQKIPLALYRDHGKILILNAGGRNPRLGKDDAERFILPELKRHGEKPTAILLTKTGVTATTGLKTLLDQYPQTPVYSLLPAEHIPFQIEFCPEKSVTDIIFQKDKSGCRGIFGKKVFNVKRR